MTKYILNAFPNSFMPVAGQRIYLQGISEQEARQWMDATVVSAIGHESTAQLFSKRLGVELKANRIQVEYNCTDQYLVGAFQLPRRLGEGETLSESEILALPIRWVLIDPLPF